MKKITKLLLICFSIALFFSCQQVVDEKTYYLNTYTVEFDANGGSGTMKFGNSNNFEQSYNLQAAVDTDSKMIVGTYSTQKCNDKAELKNCVESVPEELEKEEKVFVCADTGYFSSSLIEKTEKEHPDVKVICATEREPHGKPSNRFLKNCQKDFQKKNLVKPCQKRKCGLALKHKRDRKSTQKERQLSNLSLEL